MKKWLYVLMGAIISLGYVGSAEADKAFLKALQDTLAKLGNPWIAGETELSNLPIEEKRKMCGLLPMPEREWDPDLEEVKSPPLKKVFLDSWDWRDKDGKNWMTPVKDQTPCETCWAFAMCSAMEACIKIQNNTPDATPDLSEQFLTNCNTKGRSCYGGGTYKVYDDVKNFGVCDEACFPYVGMNKPCDDRCDDWRDRVVKITSYRTNFLTDVSDAQKKEWIMEGPMAVAITNKEDFFYYIGGVYEPIMGEDMPDHGVCCIGWTSKGGWICKNNWGPHDNPWPVVNKIEWSCWAKMEAGTGTPTIWTTDSLNFVFREKKEITSPNPSIHSSDSDKTSLSASLEFILLEGEHILKSSQIENISESSKGEDTLLYDNPGDNFRTWGGVNDWGVRFTPSQPCEVIAGLIGRTTEKEAKNDRLIVRDDASGKPGTTIEEVPYTTQTGASVIWYRQDLSTPYSDDNDFWLTYYAETDTLTRSVLISDQDGGSRSYYSMNGSSWNQHIADFLIRAIVTYGDEHAGKGTIWVKNTGTGHLVVSNVHSAGNPGWIVSIAPTSFNVYGSDSVGIEIAVDTSGIQKDVLHQDEIVITSNSNDVTTETKVPVTLFIESIGVAEEKEESMLTTLKLSPNPFRDKVGISYFVSEKANVKLVIRDITGRQVAEIVNKIENTGIKKIEWDTKNIPSGVYFCRLTTGNFESTRKVLLIR